MLDLHGIVYNKEVCFPTPKVIGSNDVISLGKIASQRRAAIYLSVRSPAFPGFHELPEILKHRLVNPFAAIIISRRLFLVTLTGPERVNSLLAATDSINLIYKRAT